MNIKKTFFYLLLILGSLSLFAQNVDMPQELLMKDDNSMQANKNTNNEAAFNMTKDSMFPLTKKQILEIRRMYNENKRALSITEDVPPKPTSSALVANLEPGETPPVIRLSSGFISSLVFLDVTGAPWPIKAYDIGDPKSFSVQWEPQKNAKDTSGMGNTLLIQSNVLYKQGNLAVMLKGLNTPIMLTLVPGQKSVDYRVDIQVPKHGPYATYSEGRLPQSASSDLLSVLNHIAPHGAKSLDVKGGRAEAWVKEDKMYIRTSYNIISPSWYSTMSSSDGAIRAYSLPPSSVVLALDHGRTISLNIGGI